uniref:Reverse transcriptase zinc-binding domain-containing protein n=1 Tax=Davidia involucrata TaxID=16924 RepID=A0A5B7BC66_DAVIN
MSYAASAVGRPLYADTHTEDRTRISFARVCVELDAKMDPPDVFDVCLADGSYVEVEIEYQWKPSLCTTCRKFGHKHSQCKVEIKEEWQVKEQPEAVRSVSTTGVTEDPIPPATTVSEAPTTQEGDGWKTIASRKGKDIAKDQSTHQILDNTSSSKEVQEELSEKIPEAGTDFTKGNKYANMPNDLNPNPVKVDTVSWTLEANGRFSTRSVWQLMRRRGQPVDWWKLVWHPKAIPRCSFILWLAIREKLNTQDKILRYGGISAMKCTFCQQPTETINHLFFDCPFTLNIWEHILVDCGLVWTPSRWQHTVNWAVVTMKGKKLCQIVSKLALAATVYNIWLECNRREFSNEHRDKVFIIRSIHEQIRGCLTCSRRVIDSRGNRLLQQKWNLPDCIFS